MKDANGRVLVSGFYDDVPPLSAEERQILAAVPDRRDELMRFFGIGRTEQVGDNLQEALQYPSLNIRGLHSGDIGDQARTIIPDRATAEIDVRLVKETDPERMLQRVLAHIRAQGFHVLMNSEPDDEMRARYPRIVRISRVESTKAYRTDMTLPESQALIRTLERAWGEPPVRNRTMGGTVPIDFFIQALACRRSSCPSSISTTTSTATTKTSGYRTSGMRSCRSRLFCRCERGDRSVRFVVFRPDFDDSHSKFLHFFQFSGVTLQLRFCSRNPC